MPSLPNAFRQYVLLSLLAVFGLSACLSQPDRTLSILYEQSAQYHKPDRNPVIVIPGILGSRLVDDASGRTVWGAFDNTSVDPRKRDDAQLLALPIADEIFLQRIRDEVRPDGVLEFCRLLVLVDIATRRLGQVLLIMVRGILLVSSLPMIGGETMLKTPNCSKRLSTRKKLKFTKNISFAMVSIRKI